MPVHGGIFLSRLIDTINSPQDLKGLPIEDLSQLAQEIREMIIETTASNGGHLAPNLGVVELTLALHYVFDTPHDKLVWDVGHQCYTHKIITGRRDQFDSIRTEGGLSGFCLKEESEYDCFSTGHSSNSISVALGMAKARDLNGAENKIVAIMGDGALTGGMAWEAMDHAGDLSTPLLVVLNDNKMSIDTNVGALNSYLSRLRSNPGYRNAKKKVRNFLERIPLLGKVLTKFISGFKHWLKSLFVSGMVFEDMGFTYLGPTDGHNMQETIDMLRRAAAVQKPVLLHVLTQKGKGYAEAEKHPCNWHGVDPFDVETGQPLINNLNMTYTATFGETIVGLAEEDSRVVAITAAMCDGTGLKKFRRLFPDRFYDVGIAEQHAVSFAAGLATAGKKPVLAIYSSFLQRAYDQILEDVCLQKLPVIFAVDRAGIIGSDGYTHQGIYDISYLRTIPGLTIMAPADTRELHTMLRFAADLNAPVAIRYPKTAPVDLPIPAQEIELGHAIIAREGTDMAFFAIGSMVSIACDAAALLRHQGINARVVNARFAAPLDVDMLKSCAKDCAGRIITLEENVAAGGFGEACQAALGPDSTDISADIISIALPNSFIPHGNRDSQMAKLGLDAESLAAIATNRWFSGNKQ